MADSSESTPSSGVTPASSETAVYIVHTDQDNSNEDPEAYHVRTLASVLGSEEAAKGALIYSYKTAMHGFSAKLTPGQGAEISKQPGVLQVVKSQTVQLHSATASFG
ncbi:hypothetical protein L484_003889 [Morus notabilis]|uniref:Inhibitor I9 domain-containing protein n=2 Tax=Morus notabilis TaxID=981085 RepID=W9S1E1_9ROSA|nr:hypothetical protein L484_003889 [Morus notabilis]